MALIEEIQATAISEAWDVSALLRKCKLLAARLDAKEFGEYRLSSMTENPGSASDTRSQSRSGGKVSPRTF